MLANEHKAIIISSQLGLGRRSLPSYQSDTVPIPAQPNKAKATPSVFRYLEGLRGRQCYDLQHNTSPLNKASIMKGSRGLA